MIAISGPESLVTAGRKKGFFSVEPAIAGRQAGSGELDAIALCPRAPGRAVGEGSSDGGSGMADLPPLRGETMDAPPGGQAILQLLHG